MKKLCGRMRRPASHLGLAAALTLLLCGAGARATAEEGFVPLFNAKDLSGWTGDTSLWRVEEGLLIGETTKDGQLPHNTFLSTEKSYSDFVLKAKVKLRNHNSGIQFRSEQLEDHAVAGYQADVAEQTYFGMLYEERKRGIMDYWKALSEEEQKAIFSYAKQGDWNEYEIRCQGSHIQMLLNGHVTCDIEDPEGAKSGIIALQLHAGPAMLVSFKDISIKDLSAAQAQAEGLLMPDVEKRKEKLAVHGERFRVPEGFQIEEVATNELMGSVINMTFDAEGRPFVSLEGRGVASLLDEDGDGHYESMRVFSEDVKSAQGLFWVSPSKLLVNADGPEGTALYSVEDTDGDGAGDQVKTVIKARGGMGEHGPHAIVQGPDGFYYVMYGNHSGPGVALDPLSPSRGLQEDYLLPRYVDPRGHANSITAPGGTIQRLSPDFQTMSQFCGGFRNSYDFGLNLHGEAMNFDSDMEWDIGQPWFKAVRVIHCIPGGDYGWRTGSSKMPGYFIDTLPSIDDVGRGSPVGVCFYYHYAFPERYWGAMFMGDWSRGRVRVVFPERSGSTYTGKALDFVVGEPLNVTDVDVSPSGDLYFSAGGRGTHGGMFRVRYTGAEAAGTPVSTGIGQVLTQPMPRSAWGKKAIEQIKGDVGDAWPRDLEAAVTDAALHTDHRLRALEALQLHSPKPSLGFLSSLARDPAEELRAAAVLLLGTFSIAEVRDTLAAAVADTSPLVARRACEALVRAGLDQSHRVEPGDPLLVNLIAALGNEDRFVRYSARNALGRIYRGIYKEPVLNLNVEQRAQAALEGLLALIYSEVAAKHSDDIFAKLAEFNPAAMPEPLLLDFLRVTQLAFIRDVTSGDRLDAFKQKLGQQLLARFPGEDWKANRELESMLAYLQTPGATGAILAYLTPDKSQEEQIHSVYCLRAIKEGWTQEQRNTLVAWFDHGRELGGGASMEGFINNLWESSLALLPDDEVVVAKARKEAALQKRMEEALALLKQSEEETGKPSGELAQMSFDELAEYFEYDPMTYRAPDLERGEKVFIKAKCADCHLFGTKGKGGGPDLSTVTSRFRRRDVLEAIMFPSKVVSDQYTGVEVELKDFSTELGLLAGENDNTLTLITINGVRREIPKSEIETRKTTEASIMPEGLLNAMSMQDLVDLVQFLEHGADV